jgi:hypothetical protein
VHKMSRRRRLDSRSCKVHSGKEPGNTLLAISVASLPAIAPRDGRREITAQDPMPLRIWGQSSLACRWQREDRSHARLHGSASIPHRGDTAPRSGGARSARESDAIGPLRRMNRQQYEDADAP